MDTDLDKICDYALMKGRIIGTLKSLDRNFITKTKAISQIRQAIHQHDETEAKQRKEG